MKGVPRDVRLKIQEKLWNVADEAGFLDLPDISKSRCYDNWVAHPEIGQRLARYLDAGQVRHYIKDAYLKRYTRERRADPTVAFRVLRLSPDTPIRSRFIKPLGVELQNGRIICWGEAKIWKSVLMALHERAFGNPNLKPMAAILSPHSRFLTPESREVVEDAAKKLGVGRVVWLSDP
jgi:hypothetical protein